MKKIMAHFIVIILLLGGQPRGGLAFADVPIPGAVFIPISADATPAAAAKADTTKATEAVKSLAIPFIANTGQTDPKVAYYVQTFAGTVFVTQSGEIVYSLPGKQEAADDTTDNHSYPVGQATRSPGWVLTETLVGGHPKLSAGTPSPTHVSYFVGANQARWTSHASTYDAVHLGEVWPGVEVTLKAYGQNLEKLFLVQPGKSVDVIRLQMGGAKGLRVSDEGALVVTTGHGEIVYTKPVAWQEQGEVHLPVEVSYRLISSSSYMVSSRFARLFFLK